MSLTWEAPDRGEWRGLHDHFPRALTPEFQGLLLEGMVEGEALHFARYGLPARTMRPGLVHGRVFIAAEPLIGGFRDHLPPTAALWLAARLVPAFVRRSWAARRALTGRIWLGEADRWYGIDRPAWQERNATLDAIDPGSLDDEALVDHLRATRANAGAGYRHHFELHGTDLMPTALYLTRSADWGVDPGTATRLLAGSSPASTGRAGLPDWALVTGYDVDERAVCELPPRPRPSRQPTGSEVVLAIESLVRAQVPPAHRAEWEVRLADARATCGVRDDNGVLTAAWPVGLLRRAMLAVGERLVDRGSLHEREHAVELAVDELAEVLLGGGSAAVAEDAEQRRDERRRRSHEPAPAVLGPSQDLPLGALPRSMRLMGRSLLTLRDLGVTPPGDRVPLQGDGIGDHAVTGRACVAADPVDALTRFEPGDVLVTAGTALAWNTVIALAGGVVTEEGGPLSHAAVIAREIGIPALVGASEAVALIPDGATVELDPVSGTVRVLS